ncbi:hypothetical protein ACIP9C_03310 [Lysinibacillus sp. NPDC093210]|uniref:hypothetical protein n=1 Tax=Lysinibacillus sp. NPDC093210 TaxID=3364133 RepID=UPI00382C4B89
MKKISSVFILFVVILGLVIPNFALAASDGRQENPFEAPEKYVSYLKSFGDTYDEFIQQYSELSKEQQEVILDVLQNGGNFDVELTENSMQSDEKQRFTRATVGNRPVSFDADFRLFGITFVKVRLEGRFEYSNQKVTTVQYKNAYIVQNFVPLSGFERTSLDAYVNDDKFYASAAFTAFVGAKIGDNIIGVRPRTFNIQLNSDYKGNVNGHAW